MTSQIPSLLMDNYIVTAFNFPPVFVEAPIHCEYITVRSDFIIIFAKYLPLCCQVSHACRDAPNKM